MNDKEGERIGHDLITTARENAHSSLERTVPSVDDDMSLTEAGKLHASLSEKYNSEDVISTHVETLEDLFGKPEKAELSDAYKQAGVKEPV